jgi:RHS repeat-associated protein
MPAWWVDEPYLNLWVTDEPLSYSTSSGQPMSFRFIYRQRYTLPQPDECPNYYQPGQAQLPRYVEDPYLSVGMRNFNMTNACWGHNWLMDMQFWDQAYELDSRRTPYSSYEALVWRPEGGIYYSGTNVSGQAALLDAQSRVRLQPMSASGRPTTNTAPPGADGFYWGEPATNGFRLLYPDGSQDVLSLCVCPPGTGITTAHAFLTKRIDAQGRATRLGYEWISFTNYWNQVSYSVMRLRYVVDPDGRTNTFLYNCTWPRHPWQVSETDDPYGRKTLLDYDIYSGLLTSIVDGAGMTNSFTYLSPSGWMNNLTTPYGTTSFTFMETTGASLTNGVSKRAVLVTEPNNTHQLYCYLHNSQGAVSATAPDVPWVPNGTLDAGTNGSSLAPLYFRNTFYWDRLQAARLPDLFYIRLVLPGPSGGFANALAVLGATNYTQASLKHWLLGSDGTSLTDLLSSERAPSPDAGGTIPGARTWYDYASKPSPEVEGFGQVGCVARLLPDLTTQYTRYTYWQAGGSYLDGLLQFNESSYTQPGGALGMRTNWYQYSVNGVDLLSITNSLGQWVNLAYNANHQVAWATNALNQVTGLTWDAVTTNLSQVSLPSGQSVGLTYYTPAHPTNFPLTSTSSLLKTITLLPQGLLVEILDYSNGLPRVVRRSGTGLPNNLTVTNSWDGLNRLTSTTFPDGTTTLNVYDRLYLGARKDRLGYWTSYGYDGLQHLTSITDARSNVTTLGWCDCGHLTSITDPLTNSTFFNYNNQGSLTNIVFADKSTVTYTLDSIGRVTNAADGLGVLKFGYNNQGLLATVSNANGCLESIVYDGGDRPFQVTDANRVTVTNQFDLLNRITARSWPDGISEGFRWATNGLVAYTNRNQKVTWFARDGAGRLTAVTNANQEVTQFGYNSLGQVGSLLDDRTDPTLWNYNEYGWLVSKTNALGQEVLRYTRDPNGQITNRWTRQFGNTGYAYDEVGNLKAINYPQSTVAYTYDVLNRLRTMADPIGTTIFSNTPTGNLQSEAGPWSSSTLTYGYTHGLRTSLSLNSLNFGYGYDSAWRLYTLSSPAGPFNYGYDAQRSALPITLTLPNSAWITNHYDSLARLDYTAMANQWGHVLDGYGYSHDPLGLRTNIVRDLGLTNSSVVAGYDSIGQLTSWKAQEGVSGPLRLNEQLAWVYDAAGNLRYCTNSGLVQTFTTDSVNQLTNVTRNSAMTVSGVTPAPASSVTVNGQSAQTYGDFTFARTNVALSDPNNTFTIIAQGAAGTRVTNTINSYLPSTINCLWDSNGNLTNDGTRSFAYDAESRLVTNWVASAWKSEFVYDGLGRRRVERDYGWQGGQWVRTNETRYIYDGYLAIQERDSNNVARVTYTRGLDLSCSLQGAGGIGGLLARTDGSGSTFYHADGAGNITGLMDGQQNMAARYLYGPFGRLTGKWGPIADANTMQFSSMPVHRQSGLSLYPFRAYDPSLQRWLNRDPIGEAGGINLYAYVRNNPLSYVDPYGEDFHVVGASGIQTPGPLGYLSGDTALENLAAGGYNAVPEVGNILANTASGAMSLLSALDQAAENLLTQLTGDQQLAQGLNNVLAVSPIGWPEDAAKLGKLSSALSKCEKAKPVTTVLSDVKVISKGKVVGRGDVYLRPTLEGIESGKITPRDIFEDRPLPGKTMPELPVKPPGYYQEFVQPTPGVGGAGSQRIVRGAGGELYYTPDHYATFVPLN